MWSPDGRTLAFKRPSHGSDKVWLMNPDGSGQRKLTRDLGSPGTEPMLALMWAAKGDEFVYWVIGGGNNRLECICACVATGAASVGWQKDDIRTCQSTAEPSFSAATVLCGRSIPTAATSGRSRTTPAARPVTQPCNRSDPANPGALMSRFSACVAAVVVVSTGILMGVGASAGVSGVASRWVRTDLGTLGGESSYGWAINNRGEVVGNSATRGGAYHAFLWRNGRMTDLDPGGVDSRATAINDRGQVVGYSRANGYVRAVLWERGRQIDLGILADGRSSSASAVNERGQVIGGADRRRSAMRPAGEELAFVWQNGKMTDLGTLGGWLSDAAGINESGQIVGTSSTSKLGNRHAFLWQNGEILDLGLGGGRASTAVAINDRGQIVGHSTFGVQHALLWENGNVTDLGTLGGRVSRAVAVNERGQIAGVSRLKNGRLHPFVWENGKMTDLGLDLPWISVRGINERGQILMEGGRSDITHIRSFVWEKGSWAELKCPTNTTEAHADAINDNSQVVGSCGLDRAVLWNPQR